MKELFPAGGKLLLAVSGGVDSLSMAELCLGAGIPFEVGHCNFSLRAEESDGDEQLVRSWCSSKGIRLNSVRFDTASYAGSRGISIEMAARELRYEWFAECARDRGCCAVAVAHNANDNAETLILNLLRGTGTRGLCGMKADGLLPISGSTMRLVRPMLGFTRKEIEAYALSTGLQYRLDSSNNDNSYKRNRVRNEVFPLFAQINPSFIETLTCEMAHFAQAQEVLDSLFLRDRPLLIVSESPLTVDISALRSSPHRKWLLYRLLEPFGFNEASIKSISECLSNPTSGKTFVSGTHKLVSSATRLVVTGVSAPALPIEVSEPGKYSINGRCFEISLAPWPSQELTLKQPEGVLILDAGRLTFPFTLRPWQDGDWFVPFGMRGRKKLSDFFTDKKMNLVEKDRAVLMAPSNGSGHIYAVLCLRPDDSLRVTKETSQILVIREISDPCAQ